jgi:N-acyl-D-amino-acid deacylase
LLQHTAGWDRETSFDPMLRPVEIAKALKVPPPANQGTIIRYMFGRPLDFDPGSRHAYSNFGYCLLGEVIRRLSGQSYEGYVRDEILAPVGIKRMRLGKSLVPAPGEVHYYDEKNRTAPAVVGGRIGKQVPSPYGGFCLEAMDSHGGWVASAIDLVRFAAALDDPRRCPFLRPAGFQAMYGRPAGPAGFEAGGKPKEAFYGCGWSVKMMDARRGNAWHAGALEGTSTLLVRRFDGLNWAVLFNTWHGPGGEQLSDLIDGKVHETADRVRAWPKYDLFNKFGLAPAARGR